MKAVIARNQQLVITQVEEPIPTKSQCLIKVSFTGINRADLLQVKGLYPPPAGESEILGLEFSGEVTQVGKDVKGFTIGDRVCSIVGSGAYAEYLCAEAEHLIKIPKQMSLKKAAALPEAFITAYQSLIQIAEIKKNERVLIHAGASGVGSAAIQLAKSQGCFVICTASAGKHLYCRNLGADECINYKKVEFQEVLSNVNVVLDLIGGSYFAGNIQVLGMEGRMVMLGFLGGVKAPSTNVSGVVTKRLSIFGSTLRARPKAYKTKLIGRFVNGFMKDESFSFKTNVDKVFDFDEVKSAHTYMEDNLNKGKILLKLI